MALIFFEGFNRTFTGSDPAQGYAGKWEWATVASVTPTFGYTSPVRNGSGALYLPTNSAAGNTAQCYADLTVTVQTNKTLFLGFAIYNLYTGYDSAATGSPYTATLLRFYDSTGAEKFRLDLDPGSNSTTMNLVFRSSTNTTHGTFLLSNATAAGADYPPTGRVYNQSAWTYLEVKITTSSTAAGSAEVHVDGLALQTSGSSATVSLPSSISNLNKVRFCANETGDVHVDDLYLLDSTGASLNTWLGPTTKVFSPELATTNADVATATDQEWDTVGSLSLDSYNPDSDYLTTKIVNKSQLYVLNSSNSLFSIPEAEIVAAVQVRSIARETSLPAAYKQVFKTNTGSAVTNVSDELQTAAYYQSATTILTANPATSAAWTLADLETAHFGVKSVTRTV